MRKQPSIKGREQIRVLLKPGYRGALQKKAKRQDISMARLVNDIVSPVAEEEMARKD